MKRRVILLSLSALCLLFVGFAQLVVAQHSIQTNPQQDLNATVQKFSGTLTAMASEIDALMQKYSGTLTEIGPQGFSATIQQIRETSTALAPYTRATPAPYKTRASGKPPTASVDEIFATITRLPPIETLIPRVGPNRSDRSVILHTDELIDIDGVIRFTITVSLIWLGILLLLSLLGAILNHLMLKSIFQSVSEGTANYRPVERIISTLYEIVISILSLYFFLSFPIFVLIITALILNLNRTISLSLLGMMILAISGYGGFYLMRAVIVGVQALLQPIRIDLKHTLSHDSSPAFWKLSQDVADRVQTRPVQQVCLVPSTFIGVLERGSLFAQLANRTERVLILGVGAINSLSQEHLQAILAHEYAHFRYRHTGAGIEIVYRVRDAMGSMIMDLREKGYNHIFNPIWVFLMLFARAYFRITLASARHAEVFADRLSAQLYSPKTCVSALLSSLFQDASLEIKIREEVKRAGEEKRLLNNIYQLPELNNDQKKLALAFVMWSLNRPTHIIDSHPSVGVRLAFFSRVTDVDVNRPVAEGSAWELFDDPESIQRQMTEIVQKNVNFYRFYKERIAVANPQSGGQYRSQRA